MGNIKATQMEDVNRIEIKGDLANDIAAMLYLSEEGTAESIKSQGETILVKYDHDKIIFIRK